MKTMKRFASVLALLLALMMLFAACGPAEDVSSGDDTQDEVSSDETIANTPSDTTEDEDDTSSTGTNSKDNNSKNNSSKNNTSAKKTGKQDAFNNANDATFLKSAPKGGIHILMWRKWHPSEELLVKQYEKATGNKVKVTVVQEKEYTTKLVSMVAGGNSPDVVCFSAGDFPGVVVKALQPLSNEDFQLDSDCWNKAYMDPYKVNGVYYGVAMPQSWSCEDCTYVTYYSPAILKQSGVTATPYQLYKQGKWDWAAQKDIATKVQKSGKTGISVQSFDMFMLSAGEDFVSYDGVKYTNKLGSLKGGDMLTKAWMEAATLNQNKVLTGWDINSVQQGKVGLFTAISYGLYNEGDWFQKSFAKNLEAVPVAGPVAGTTNTPVRPKCWGVAKDAKNAEGAAYFLRYFLDTSAFNFDSTFHNEQFGEVYKIITKSTAKKTVMHGSGVVDYIKSDTYSGICKSLVASSPQNVNTNLNAKKGNVQTGIASANKALAKEAKKNKK